MADAPARVGVRRVDQLADRVLAVADHRGRDALGDRRDLAADDEAAVVVAGDVASRPRRRRCGSRGGRPRRPRGRRRRCAGRGATPRPWLPSSGLTTHGKPIRFAASMAPSSVVDDRRLRHRQPGRVEQAVGQVLVAGDVDADRGRARGHRRPDPLLVDAVAQLDERVAVQAQVRDVARGRLVEDRLGGRAEGLALGEEDQALELGDVVEGVLRVVRRDEVVDDARRRACPPRARRSPRRTRR